MKKNKANKNELTRAEKKKLLRRRSLGDLVRNMFTSDYDIKLDESVANMRKSTYRIYSFMNKEHEELIPLSINNAIPNLILVLLTDGNKILPKMLIRSNINYYLNLAKMAYDTHDHNTVILIRAALLHSVMERINIKRTRKYNDYMKLFEEKYGSFQNSHKVHLNDMVKNVNPSNYLPSVMILMIHIKKLMAYQKEYMRNRRSFGEIPSSITTTLENLTNVKNAYLQTYAHSYDTLVNLYTEDPMKNNVMQMIEGTNIDVKLFKLVNIINKN
tara:strand:+ start:12012 stop:12827 length:816 start_codon:yes stop_codon:yes gene_type:complete